jgi:hypothetical protein
MLGVMMALGACSKPVDSLRPLTQIALVSVTYDANVYVFNPNKGVDMSRIYAQFSGERTQTHQHDLILNEFLIDLMSETVKKADISIVRPLKLLNTSLMQDNRIIRYEYLLDPYDPIDIYNRVFMAGLADQLSVDAVAHVSIQFAVHLDEKMLWEEYNDPYAKTLSSYRMQVQLGHETSQLRTMVTLTVVNAVGDLIYNETRHVDIDTDQIHVDDRELSFDGGISPKLLRFGLDEWLYDWGMYL